MLKIIYYTKGCHTEYLVVELKESEPERPVYALVDALIVNYFGSAAQFLHESQIISGLIAFSGTLQECQGFSKKSKGVLMFTIKKLGKGRKSESDEFKEQLNLRKAEKTKSQVQFRLSIIFYILQ